MLPKAVKIFERVFGMLSNMQLQQKKPFVTDNSINTEIYINECFKKSQLPFIELHSMHAYFLPDLPSCHWGKKALEWRKKNNVIFVNPPN